MATLKVTGRKRVGKRLAFKVGATDAGGIASIVLRFGDGKKRSATKPGTFRHAYKKAKRDTVRLTVEDKAGNTRAVERKLKIKRRRARRS